MDRWDFNKVAFVASGGAFKALGWHVGVAMALKEYGFAVISRERDKSGEFRPIQHVIGSSGGAIFGSVIANGLNEIDVQRLDKKQLLSYFFPVTRGAEAHITDFSYWDVFTPNIPNLGKIREIVKHYLEVPHIFMKYGPGLGIEALIRELVYFDGLFTLDRFEKFLRRALPVNCFEILFEKFNVDLSIVATEVNNPRKAIFGRHQSPWIGTKEDNFYRDRYLNGASISEAVAASCAIGPIFKPMTIDGVDYFDGEIKQSLSVNIASDNGADLIFVSHTFKPYIHDESMGNLSDMYSLLMQELYTSVYQKIQTPKQYHQQKLKLYNRIKSSDFREKYHLDAEQHKEIVDEICETILFDPKRQYIFISPPNELFFLDHFNLLSYANREVMSAGYYMTRKIMDLNEFPRLKRYEKRGILESRRLRRFRFPTTGYERYKERVKRFVPSLD